MTTVLMLASFGLEIIECGGALARHVQAGDRVYAAVTLSRPESRPQVCEAAAILGIKDVEFLGFAYGEFTVDVPSKEKIVSLVRRVRPDIVITQDPVHAQHDLDPDRRIMALLYTESFALAGRDWHVAECGGHEPHSVRSIYYMTPEEANCIIEIGEVFALKQKALEALQTQMVFSAEVLSRLVTPDTMRHLVPNLDELSGNPAALGLQLSRQFFMADAVHYGLAGHSGAVLGEPYRREGVFVLDKLAK
jgi:LmbE family N-acetylglucosaminyl deacetylase